MWVDVARVNALGARRGELSLPRDFCLPPE